MNLQTEFKCEGCEKIFPKNKPANRKYCVVCSAAKNRVFNKKKYDLLHGNRDHKCKSCDYMISDSSKKTCDVCKREAKCKRNLSMFVKKKIVVKPKHPEDFHTELLGCAL